MYEIKLDVAVMQNREKFAYDIKSIKKHNSSLQFIPQKKNSTRIWCIKKHKFIASLINEFYNKSTGDKRNDKKLIKELDKKYKKYSEQLNIKKDRKIHNISEGQRLKQLFPTGNGEQDVNNTSFSNETKYSLSREGLQRLAEESGDSYSSLEANLSPYNKDTYSIKRH